MAITNMEESSYQDDMKWTVSEVSDMCIPDDPAIKNTMDDMAYLDENTSGILDQELVKVAEKAEIARFKKMGVYTYVRRSEALNDPDGSFVKVKWVRTNEGTAAQPNIRCRLVAQVGVRAADRRTLLQHTFADVDEDGHRTCSQGSAGHCGHGREVCFSLQCLSPPYPHRASPPGPQARCGRSCRPAP